MLYYLVVRVIPCSNKRSCGYDKAGRITVRLRASPQQGAANKELIDYFSDLLHIARSKIRIVSGHTSRIKRLEIEASVPESELYHKLGLEIILQTTIKSCP